MLLYQSPNGYCYNSDSIFLAHFIASFSPKGKMLDVGCGIGVLSLILAREFDIKANIIDKQSHMINFAKHNFAINEIDVEFFNEDFMDFEPEAKFDVIISNPPFYNPSVLQSNETIINTARYAHHLPLDDFFKKVHKNLTPSGKFFFCYDAKQIVDIIIALKKYHLTPEVIRFVHSKKDKDSKLVMIACRHNSKSVAKIVKPLVVFDDENNYMQEASEAFKFANLHSIKGEMNE
ncbi:MAG: methyltransferase [Sulfurovaceae bacterium]|nr:methyltransferase [Sulfurovaceae bacterium]MDD5548228.1 methyltransferase [Sulfurovaceae bacterium]